MQLGRCFCLVALLGCSDLNPQGRVGFCFAAASDPEQIGRSETRAGLRRADDDVEPPESFAECALGMPVQGTFIDDEGDTLFLALDAVLGGRDLLPRNILSAAEGGTLSIVDDGGFAAVQKLSLMVGLRPLIALESGGNLSPSTFGVMNIEPAWHGALTAVSPCGTATEIGLRFFDDRGAKVAAPREQVELIVGGVESAGINLHSLDRGIPGCTDSGGLGTDATWLFHDNSF